MTISIKVDRYPRILEHAISKVDFSIGTFIRILPSSLNLDIGKTAGYNSKLLISNIDMKIDSNRIMHKAEI